MDHREVRALADSYLAGELLVETTHELVRHLEVCPECREEIDGRRRLREKLRAALAGSEALRPRSDFAAELAAKLRPQAAPTSRRTLLQSWWAVAAGVVLAAGGGVVVRDARHRSRLAALARTAAGDHMNCAIAFHLAEAPVPLDEAARRFGAPYAALASFQLSESGTDLTALARHSCVYDGQRFGHVVFKYNDAVTSLLVTSGTPPGAPEFHPQGTGPGVVTFPAGRYVAFLVASLDQASLEGLAIRLSGPLGQRLG